MNASTQPPDVASSLATAARRQSERPRPLRVIFAVGGLYTEASGVARIVADLANTLGAQGQPVDVYTAECGRRKAIRRLLTPPSRCVTADGWWLGRLAYSPKLARQLCQAAAEADVIHSHSLWMLPTHYASSAARRHGKPDVITCHGFLEPWALRHSWWKKRLAWSAFQKRDLARAACIHVNSQGELENVRRLGFHNPMARIPNGVELAEQPASAAIAELFPELAGKKICLFLSRLHQKKGLIPLIDAWSRLHRDFPQWHLLIAGPDDGGKHTLRGQVRDLQLQATVTIADPVYGSAKQRLLAAADVFALPSFSEGFSMAVLEALAAGLPALITPGCNFPDVEPAGAGVVVQPTAADAARGLCELFERTDEERAEMGRKGRDLVRRHYTWQQVAARTQELYDWLVGGGTPPEFVDRG